MLSTFDLCNAEFCNLRAFLGIKFGSKVLHRDISQFRGGVGKFEWAVWLMKPMQLCDNFNFPHSIQRSGFQKFLSINTENGESKRLAPA